MTKVAILYWGLTKRCEATYPSMNKYIFDIFKEKGIQYDVYLHTYIHTKPYYNPWSHENCILDNENYKILQPNHVVLDNHDDVVQSIDFTQYHTTNSWIGSNPGMYIHLTNNLVLALYSKKRVTELFEPYKDNYDYVIFMRPDAEFTTYIYPDFFDFINDSNILVPDFDWHRGCNDRFCITNPKNALIYGKLFNHLIEFPKLDNGSSELYLMTMLKYYNLIPFPIYVRFNLIRRT